MPLEVLHKDPRKRPIGLGFIKETGRETIRTIEFGLFNIFEDGDEDKEGPRFSLADSFDRSCPWEKYCKSRLITALVELHKVLIKDYELEDHRKCNGTIPIVSAYRRVGTSVPPRDPVGRIDFYDRTEATHWRGLAVDVSQAIPRGIFKNDLDELDSVLARPTIGLKRTNDDEDNHFALVRP